jgi:hypothetical protein
MLLLLLWPFWLWLLLLRRLLCGGAAALEAPMVAGRAVATGCLGCRRAIRPLRSGPAGAMRSDAMVMRNDVSWFLEPVSVSR